jgi:uncharacterized protein (DUF427 family)
VTGKGCPRAGVDPGMSRPVLKPSDRHPITVTPTGAEVVVRVGDVEIARSRDALSLAEADYPVVQYLPIEAVDPARLRPSGHDSYCPFKGEASYLSLELPDGQRLDDVIWRYEQPYEAVAQIAGRVAFYADRVQITVS